MPIAETASADPVHQLFELSLDMLGMASADGYFVGLNPAWERTLGWSRQELMTAPLLSFIHPDDVEAAAALAMPLTDGREEPVIAFEARFRKQNGDYLWLASTTVAQDDVVYLVAHEITDRKEAEADRERAQSLAQAIAMSVVDGLYVVDTMGRLTFINPAALRMLGYQSDEVLLGRGPHAIFHHTRTDGTPYPREECPLLDVLTDGKPIHSDEDCFWRSDGSPLHVSYSAAPITLVDGTGSVVAFRDISLQMVERERVRALGRHVAWFDEIRKALNDGRFVLYGQPIIRLSTGDVVTHELLLRMISPTGEVVAPGEFLPAAEKYGLINDIDRWVISEAVAMAAAGWNVALNLSAESMGRVEILLHIERELERTGARPGNLIFEVTETALMLDVPAGRRFADRLVALGCSLALDDFGTGYGSLTYLREFPISLVKIDVEFVRGLTGSEPDQKLVQSIVHMAKSLGKLTVAEGAEDETTVELLRSYGVDFVQGYHLGRPEPLPPIGLHPGDDHAPFVQDAAAGGEKDPGPSNLGRTADWAAFARSRDESARSRDLAADARDHAAEREQRARVIADESAHQDRLAASHEARAEAAADRADAASDRQDAETDRGRALTESGAAGLATQSEAARERDASATSRDAAAAGRDLEAGRDEASLTIIDAITTDDKTASTDDIREEAAADRASAAEDREWAAADRRRAALDSNRASIGLEHAQLDGVAGVYAGEIGDVMLQNEIDRSRHSGTPFALVVIHVHEFDDRSGPASGDLLRVVIDAARAELRSYDPIVRVAGDEFLCGLAGGDVEAGRRRLEAIRAGLEAGSVAVSISVGVAILAAGDTLRDLVTRAGEDRVMNLHSD